MKFLSVAMLVIAIAGSYYFPKVQQTVNQVLGAVSTLDGIDLPFVSIGGLKEYHFSAPLTATSSFICVLKNPYNATTSIESIGAESTNAGIAAANTLYVSTSTTAFGTSSPAMINGFAMGTGQWTAVMQKNTGTSSADTTVFNGMNSNGTSNYRLAPNEWITWKIATTTGGTFVTYDQGTCSAVLKRP